MRSAQKQEVLELIESLHQAHEEIKEALAQNNSILAQNMIAECQEFAITLGESIEKLEGEGHAAVSCVEEYCEALFHIHEELADGQISENKIYKRLKKQLIKVENSAKNDIRVRKEVVFFPYKASMWDSLESVWKAADEDPNCDSYVVPIPYYDKRPDGSLGKMHYEGNEYPEYVPITSYEKYRFESRKPDCIYIHNPYDNYNIVTSVPARFFSENLKKYTDELVYIPYFVLGEIKPEEEDKIEGMKHFCTLPGVFHADKVIVQSEDMKQVYVKVLLDATNDHSEAARKYWDNKILGLGSPKMDKVLNTKKEDLEIPQEWLKIIEKPDGNRKKIVFYNTSVGALLQHNEKMLEKMNDVFRLFQENQDEIALLWRPHPLIKATVESMRPQLWGEYDKLVRKYREEGWGIYDDSSDVDRAIVLSDAYYGDGSSVVQMYQQTGKPVMMQNVNESVENVTENYFATRWIKDGEYVYFVPFYVSFGLNVLIKYNVQNSKIEWALPIERESSLQDGLYADILKYKNKIVLVPLHAKNFAIIDLETQKIEYIAIPMQDVKADYGFFSKGVIYKNELIAVGYLYPGIVRINLDDYKIQIVNGWYKDLQNVLTYESCIAEDCIYCLVKSANKLLKYDLSKDETVVYQLDNKAESAYQCICYDGQYFWFTSDGINFLKWNESMHDSYEIISEETRDIPEGTVYGYSTSLNGKNYFFPFNKEAPIVVKGVYDNTKTELIWQNSSIKKGYMVNSYYKYEDSCFLFNYQGKKTYRISENNNCENFNGWKKDPKWQGKLFGNFEDIYLKESGISLKEYIQIINQR